MTTAAYAVEGAPMISPKIVQIQQDMAKIKQNQPYQQPPQYEYPPSPIQYEYQPPQQQQHQLVPISMIQPRFGYASIMAFCPNCQKLVKTKLKRVVGLATLAGCGGLLMIGCWPCCLIPCCVEECKDVKHLCPECNNLLGIKKIFS